MACLVSLFYKRTTQDRAYFISFMTRVSGAESSRYLLDCHRSFLCVSVHGVRIDGDYTCQYIVKHTENTKSRVE